jgi:dynein heavy chain
VSEEAKVVEAKKADAKIIADDAEKDLAAAKPELEAAKAAVAQLNKDSITEIKSFPNPPKAVVMVMEAIMILLSERTDWKTIREQITDTNGFIERLRSFNVMSTAESLFNKVKNNYLSKPEFDIADIKKKSVAASFMAMWVKAVNRYQEVTKVVVPKQKRYNEVKAVLDQAEADLALKMGEVQKVRDKVAGL